MLKKVQQDALCLLGGLIVLALVYKAELQHLLKNFFSRLDQFFADWEKQILTAEREREEKSLIPLAEPCPGCSGLTGKYLFRGWLNPLDGIRPLASPMLYATWPYRDPGIPVKVCANCGRPVE